MLAAQAIRRGLALVSNDAALDASGTAPAAQGQRTIEIAAGQKMQGAHDGKSIFLDGNVFGALQQLADALDPAGAQTPLPPGTDQREAVLTAGRAVDAAFDVVQRFVGDVGARQNRADTVKGGLDANRARVLLNAQVGAGSASRHIAAAGNASVAHRAWFMDFVGRNIRPERFAGSTAS